MRSMIRKIYYHLALAPLSSLLIFALLIFSNTALAAKGSLIPCSGVDCTLCDLFTLAKNVINFLLEIGLVLAGAFFAWGAFDIMTAGGSENKVKQGRERMTIAITGVAIGLTAWLIIGLALQVFTGSPSKLPWNEIKCNIK